MSPFPQVSAISKMVDSGLHEWGAGWKCDGQTLGSEHPEGGVPSERGGAGLLVRR